MTRLAREIEPGDMFITSAVRVSSVMTEGDSTFIAWEGENRRFDTLASDAMVENIIPIRCIRCGFPIVGGEEDE